MNDVPSKSLLEIGSSTKSKSRRGSLGNLFNSLYISSSSSTSNNRRKQKPLPTLPATTQEKISNSNQYTSRPPLQPATSTSSSSAATPIPAPTKALDIKRVCIPDDRSILDFSLFSSNIPIWKRVDGVDPQGRTESYFYNSVLKSHVRGCCVDSKNIVSCCALCDHPLWIFQGSEYNPEISFLYAKNDGCIPFDVKLNNPKFIIPWRYKNRKTGSISWKIIHLCGNNVEDAECETLVVNIYRDRSLRKVIEKVCVDAGRFEGAERVNYLLRMVRRVLGDYGLDGGATSSQADASLFAQMKEQGHNFMFLGNVKVGLCRHKAMLFKILCDAVDIECALVTGYSTGGRHQWNVIKIFDPKEGDTMSFIIDPTSPHFTWAKSGSARLKAYKIHPEQSFGHGGLTLLKNMSRNE